MTKTVTKYYKWGEPNFNIVGTPTVSNGIMSGFTTANYGVIPNYYKSNNMSYVFKFTTGTDIETEQYITHGEYFVLIAIGGGGMTCYNWGTATTTVLTSVKANTTYWVKITVSGTQVTYYVSTNGTSWTQKTTYTDSKLNTAHTKHQFRIGLSSYNTKFPFLGTIDLKECYLEQNNIKCWTFLKIVTGTSSSYNFTKQEQAGYAIKKQVTRYFKYGTTINGIIVGAPTFENGVGSNFASSRYVKTPQDFTVAGGNTWEIVAKAIPGTNINSTQSVFGHINSDTNDPVCMELKSGKFCVHGHRNKDSQIFSITSSITVTTGTPYWLKTVYDGSNYIFSMSTDGKTYTEQGRVASTYTIWNSRLCFGRQQGHDSEYPFLGSIDFKECYIKIDGKLWWTGTHVIKASSSDYNYTETQNAYYVRKANSTKYYKWGKPNANVVGTPTVNKQLAQDFTTSNYLQMPFSFNSLVGSSSWEVVGKFKITTASKWNPIYGGTNATYLLDIFVNTSNKFAISLSSNGKSYNIANEIAGTHTVAANKYYWVKLKFTGTQYILSYSTDGSTFTNDITVESTTVMEATTDCLCIGFRSGNSLYGVIDLSGCYMNIAGKRVWNGISGITGSSSSYDFTKSETCYYSI